MHFWKDFISEKIEFIRKRIERTGQRIVFISEYGLKGQISSVKDRKILLIKSILLSLAG